MRAQPHVSATGQYVRRASSHTQGRRFIDVLLDDIESLVCGPDPTRQRLGSTSGESHPTHREEDPLTYCMVTLSRGHTGPTPTRQRLDSTSGEPHPTRRKKIH
jgi:hypothetical protein